MRQWLRSHLTYANVMSTLAVFLILGGGTALGAYVVSSNSQIGPGTVSGHTPPTGNHANVIAGSINGGDVANNSLKGADIADRSGVDTCPSGTTKFGPICAGSDGAERSFDDAVNYCADLGLGLPSYSEAVALGRNYDVPGVGFTELFWTDEEFFYNNGLWFAELVNENGTGHPPPQNEQQSYLTVCVTDPSA